jgi:hypothetical protein
MDVKQTGHGHADCTQMTLDRLNERTFVNTVMNIRVVYSRGFFDRVSIKFSRKTALQRVSKSKHLSRRTEKKKLRIVDPLAGNLTRDPLNTKNYVHSTVPTGSSGLLIR